MCFSLIFGKSFPQVDQGTIKLDGKRRRSANNLWKPDRRTTLSTAVHLPLCRTEPKPRLYELRQFPLVHAHHFSTHHFRLLGECLQYG